MRKLVRHDDLYWSCPIGNIMETNIGVVCWHADRNIPRLGRLHDKAVSKIVVPGRDGYKQWVDAGIQGSIIAGLRRVIIQPERAEAQMSLKLEGYHRARIVGSRAGRGAAKDKREYPRYAQHPQEPIPGEIATNQHL